MFVSVEWLLSGLWMIYSVPGETSVLYFVKFRHQYVRGHPEQVKILCRQISSGCRQHGKEVFAGVKINR